MLTNFDEDCNQFYNPILKTRSCNMEILGFTLDVIGKIMVAFTAIMVHHRFRKEHKVDERVFRSMRREQVIAIAGIGLIILGFLLQLPSKL